MSRTTRETTGRAKAASTFPKLLKLSNTDSGISWDAAEGADAGDLATGSVATATMEPPHDLERAIRRELMQREDLRFSSLVVRRMPNGVVLEGVMERDDDAPDVADVVRAADVARAIGVDRVVNRLVIRAQKN